MREHGKELGFSYPQEIPTLSLMGPTPSSNPLSYTKALPFPPLLLRNILAGTRDIYENDEQIIMANVATNNEELEQHHKRMVDSTVSFYEVVADKLLKDENFLSFFL